MKVSEKTLELNVGAELLNLYRIERGWSRMYLQGLTQRQESQAGVDFFAQLSPHVRIAAFQFKAPFREIQDRCPYKFKIQRKQHSNLRRLAIINRNSVFYVLPFYATHHKLQHDVPNLLQDTWMLPIERMNTSDVFGLSESKIVQCVRGYAYINPEFKLYNARELEIPSDAGIPVWEFVNWYRKSLLPPKSHYGIEMSVPRRKNTWIFRGLKVAIIES